MRRYSYHEHSEIRKPSYYALYADISSCDATELGVGKPLQRFSSMLLQDTIITTRCSYGSRYRFSTLGMTSDENNVSGDLVQALDCAPRSLTPSYAMHDIPRNSKVRKTVPKKNVSASLDHHISFSHLRLDSQTALSRHNQLRLTFPYLNSATLVYHYVYGLRLFSTPLFYATTHHESYTSTVTRTIITRTRPV